MGQIYIYLLILPVVDGVLAGELSRTQRISN